MVRGDPGSGGSTLEEKTTGSQHRSLWSPLILREAELPRGNVFAAVVDELVTIKSVVVLCSQTPSESPDSVDSFGTRTCY